MNTNYNFITLLFQDFTQQNSFVQAAILSFDDQRSEWYTRLKQFPAIYGVIRSVNLDEQIVRWNIDVYFLDLLLDNRSNEVSVMNNTLEIANQFQNFIHKNKDNNYTINQFSTLTPLNNFDNNRMNGWRVNMTLESKREQCFDGTFLPTPPGPVLPPNAIYTTQQIDDFIAQGYIPVANSQEFESAIVNNIVQTMGAGTIWEGQYETGGFFKKYIQVDNIEFPDGLQRSAGPQTDGLVYDGNGLDMLNVNNWVFGGNSHFSQGLFREVLNTVEFRNAVLTNIASLNGFIGGRDLEVGTVIENITFQDFTLGGNETSILGWDFRGIAKNLKFENGVATIRHFLCIQNFGLIKNVEVDGLDMSVLPSSSNPRRALISLNNGVISDLTIKNVDFMSRTTSVTFENMSGIVVGRNNNPGVMRRVTLQDSRITTPVGVMGNQTRRTGTFAGLNAGLIENCHCLNCEFEYNGNSIEIGGFVGWNNANGVIINCYTDTDFTTNVTTNVGGFVGLNQGVVINSYFNTDKTQFTLPINQARDTQQLEEGVNDSIVNGDNMYTGWDDVQWNFRTETELPIVNKF